ncbi:hypothetical protein B2M20_07815 [Nitrobacter vulgaris]|uniref:Uncharacterized protein n=1 Tax=Nitrobacter vulgaris TaxID=29421 RepID=A0A1V4HZB4_NITVU|nr:hypothetical protein B2M20_07815 [Nitrobacter vulgaris]
MALAMFLDDDAEALRRYKAGDRSSDRVVNYFGGQGLEGPAREWREPCSIWNLAANLILKVGAL